MVIGQTILPHKSLDDYKLIIDVFSEMKKTPHFGSTQSKFFYLNRMKELYNLALQPNSQQIIDCIQALASVCDDEAYIPFTTECELTYSFYDAFFLPLSERRRRASSIDFNGLDMKMLPMLSVYSSPFLLSLSSPEVSYCWFIDDQVFFKKLLVEKKLFSGIVLREACSFLFLFLYSLLLLFDQGLCKLPGVSSVPPFYRLFKLSCM